LHFPNELLSAFPFENPSPPVSLYKHAPVFHVSDQRGHWVIKRTGGVHSSGSAIAAWLFALRASGVSAVAPVPHFSPNPRLLSDGREWVVYPFIPGEAYRGSKTEILRAGRLLGHIHATNPPEVSALTTFIEPIVRASPWIEHHLRLVLTNMKSACLNPAITIAAAATRAANAAQIPDLPLAGCSFDFKASNLVFGQSPTLIDPDHAARIPRAFDLAIALLLFHCDMPTAPGRLWTPMEWQTFLEGYREHITFTPHEMSMWDAILDLAWLDQGLWLLGNWSEGWADPKEQTYLFDLATIDIASYPLSH